MSKHGLLMAALLLSVTACTSVQEALHTKRPEGTSLLLTLVPLEKPATGKPVVVNAKITHIKDRALVHAENLSETDNGVPPFFALDNSFTDFQPIHAEQEKTSGLYRFTFTPKNPGSYRIWAKAALSGEQFPQYPFADLGTRTPGKFTRAEALQQHWDGYTVTLVPESPFIRFHNVAFALRATNASGTETPVTIHEVTGFYSDYRGVEHINPSKQRVSLAPDHEGFIKLFVRASIDGKETTLPFTAQIAKE
ncbi:MAG: hypothetical protein K2Q01_05165 [Rickettsiales bacterium]|nr:hypothetical protein [Rickettsiales bacterium]